MTSIDEIARSCICLHTRMAARAVTRAYNAALKPLGLEVTQFSLLAAIARTAELEQPGETGAAISVAELSETLALERTTLVRNLALLERTGLIARQGGDKRRARWVLTPTGRAKLDAAVPAWEGAQRGLEATITRPIWDETRRRLRDIRKAASI